MPRETHGQSRPKSQAPRQGAVDSSGRVRSRRDRAHPGGEARCAIGETSHRHRPGQGPPAPVSSYHRRRRRPANAPSATPHAMPVIGPASRRRPVPGPPKRRSPTSRGQPRLIRRCPVRPQPPRSGGAPARVEQRLARPRGHEPEGEPRSSSIEPTSRPTTYLQPRRAATLRRQSRGCSDEGCARPGYSSTTGRCPMPDPTRAAPGPGNRTA